MSELLPCPFCGCGAPPVMQGNGIGDNWLECVACKASTRLREDGAGSERDWNRRADSAEITALCNSLSAWIKENAPGGWIDTLRSDNAALRTERDALRELHSAVVDYVASTHHVPSNDIDAALDRIEKLGGKDA